MLKLLCLHASCGYRSIITTPLKYSLLLTAIKRLDNKCFTVFQNQHKFKRKKSYLKDELYNALYLE